jgi:hypothetical protein
VMIELRDAAIADDAVLGACGARDVARSADLWLVEDLVKGNAGEAVEVCGGDDARVGE